MVDGEARTRIESALKPSFGKAASGPYMRLPKCCRKRPTHVLAIQDQAAFEIALRCYDADGTERDATGTSLRPFRPSSRFPTRGSCALDVSRSVFVNLVR
eukprot:scaffold370_cov349-Pavlova_lutheri.AAC.19